MIKMERDATIMVFQSCSLYYLLARKPDIHIAQVAEFSYNMKEIKKLNQAWVEKTDKLSLCRIFGQSRSPKGSNSARKDIS